MNIQSVPIETLVFDPSNANKHNKKNIEAIKYSLSKFRQQKPIVVDADNIVIAGNGTLEAAKALGWTHIAVHKTHLKGAEAVAYAIADNRTAELADWDKDTLGSHLQGLREDDWVLEDLGFELDDLDQLDVDFKDMPDPEKDDQVPEVAQNIHNVQLGQIWQLGEHRLMCGDSTDKATVDKLMNGEKADMVFTDPPYGIDYQDLKKSHKKIANDKNISGLLTCLSGLSVPMFVCCNWRCMQDMIDEITGVEFKACIVWDKTCRVQNLDKFGKQHEFILYAGPYGGQKTIDVDVWQCKRQVLSSHPTAKPVELIERAFSAVVAKRVFEPFCGSGSTLIACEKTNRTCYGMELDPHYCSVIIERWQQYTDKKATLVNSVQ